MAKTRSKRARPSIPIRDKSPVSVEIVNDQLEEYGKLYELQSNLHAQSDSILQHRTNAITLTQGLLFVGYYNIVPTAEKEILWVLALATISLLGFLISLMWLFYEQRNLIFYRSRVQNLVKLEEAIEAHARLSSIRFVGFWKDVPTWVAANAKWYQRFSAQRVIRFFIPLCFCLAWLILLLLCSLIRVNDVESTLLIPV